MTADPYHDPSGRPPIGDLIDQTLDNLVADAYAAGQVNERQRIRKELRRHRVPVSFGTASAADFVSWTAIKMTLDGA